MKNIFHDCRYCELASTGRHLFNEGLYLRSIQVTQTTFECIRHKWRVGIVRLELTHLAVPDSKSGASANSTISPLCNFLSDPEGRQLLAQPWFPHLRLPALNVIYFSTGVCRHLFQFHDWGEETHAPQSPKRLLFGSKSAISPIWLKGFPLYLIPQQKLKYKCNGERD